MSDFATNGKLDLDNKKKWEFGRLNAVRIAQRLVLTSFAYKGRGNKLPGINGVDVKTECS